MFVFCLASNELLELKNKEVLFFKLKFAGKTWH